MGQTGKQNWKTNLEEIQRGIRTLSSRMENKQGTLQERNREKDKQTDQNKNLHRKKSQNIIYQQSKNQFYNPLIYKHIEKEALLQFYKLKQTFLLSGRKEGN